MDPDELPSQFQIGRAIGDGAAMVTGTIEMVAGVVGEIGSGIGAVFTGGASLAGTVPSTAAIAHGASAVRNGWRNFGSNVDAAQQADRFEVVNSSGHPAAYEDGTVTRSPGNISGPDKNAEGRPHTVLMEDKQTGRIYKAREYGEGGKPVRDIDFTQPTNKDGVPYNDHILPHQHTWKVNPDSPNGSLMRSKAPELVPGYNYELKEWVE